MKIIITVKMLVDKIEGQLIYEKVKGEFIYIKGNFIILKIDGYECSNSFNLHSVCNIETRMDV